MSKQKNHRWLKAVLIAVGVVVAVLAIAVAWWNSTAYAPDAAALAAVADEDGASDGVIVERLDDGSLAFVADDPRAGMVFYPGAKVDPEAYAPLLTDLARAGVTCVLVKPPLDFALLSIGAAGQAMEQFPQIDTWLLAGHSLGGVAACEYLAAHQGDFAGIVLLASYPNTDLTGFGGEVLALVGTEDDVVDRDALAAARDLLPEGALELEIVGGNHAFFGDYGEQDGDGTATISREEQQEQLVEAVLEMLDAA